VVADKTSGIIAALAIVSALAGRQKTGRGGFVEIPMFESMVAFNLVEHLYGWHDDPPAGPMGYVRALSHSRGPFRTRDGHISVMPYTDKHWVNFFTRVGASELLADERYADISRRTANIDTLYDALSEFLLTHETAYWLDLCEEEQIPAAPVLTLEDLAQNDHLLKTDFFSNIDDSILGRVRFPGIPVAFGGIRPRIEMPPRLGQHTCEILAEAGLSESEILALTQSGVASQHGAEAAVD
jgi:crotonobetainyl-CoA:carnitine CoA-transferase CaiB-like acyl-CoA transferase